jgi:predicted transcriptional regulator
VDEPTDLPEGSAVDLLVLDADEAIPEEDRSAVESSIDEGLAEIERGEIAPAEQVIGRLRDA